MKTTLQMFEQTTQPPISPDNCGRADAGGRSPKPKRPSRPPPWPRPAILSIAGEDGTSVTPSLPPSLHPLAAPPLLAPIAPIHVQSSDTGGKAKSTQLDPCASLMEAIRQRVTFKPKDGLEAQDQTQVFGASTKPKPAAEPATNNPLISMIRFEILSP